MEKTTQGINPSTPRDYDKDPIVIEDYNYIFYILYVIWGGAIIAYLYLVNPFHNSNEVSKRFWLLHFIIMSVLPIITFYFQMRKSKRKLFLQENEIVFKENEKIIEKIDLKNVQSIKRTFNDYYMKNQDIEDWSIVFVVLFLPFNLPIQLINKFLFHVFKDGILSYRFFDSFIVFDKNQAFINILPNTRSEYKHVVQYFGKRLGFQTENAEIFFKLNYGNEKGANK
ncbi:MAG: hypothetical protein PHQ22_10160 [Sulfuricurvum sp.]|nr:hypothetical protein [Sulfuricurvum sp.]MDD5387543.1 hypothetical protein [Sulfuricurvum sp.]